MELKERSLKDFRFRLGILSNFSLEDRRDWESDHYRKWPLMVLDLGKRSKNRKGSKACFLITLFNVCVCKCVCKRERVVKTMKLSTRKVFGHSWSGPVLKQYWPLDPSILGSINSWIRPTLDPLDLESIKPWIHRHASLYIVTVLSLSSPRGTLCSWMFMNIKCYSQTTSMCRERQRDLNRHKLKAVWSLVHFHWSFTNGKLP